MNIIRGILIRTNVTIASTDYGLFAVSGGYSEFRFVESAITVTGWNDSFILKNGLPDIIKTCDLVESGNTVQSNDVTVRLKNTSQLDKFISSNGISLPKSTVEFHTFIGTNEDSDSIGHYVDAIRTIEETRISETELTLKVKMSLSKQRNKRLSATLDEVNYPYVPDANKNKLIPLIFGSSDPVNKRFFKLLQSSAKEIKYYSEDWFIDTPLPGDPDDFRDLFCLSPGAYKFPQVQTEIEENSVHVQGLIPLSPLTSGYEIALRAGDWFESKYLKCVNGSTGNTNTIRKILSASNPWGILIATMQDYFADLPIGNSSYDATDQTHFELYDLDFKYILSYYELLGFYDSVTLLEKTLQPEIFSKIDEDVIRVLSSSVEPDISENNITLNPRIYKGENLTTILNYETIKPQEVALLTVDEFAPGSAFEWRISVDGTSPTEYVPGLFVLNGTTVDSQAIQTNKDLELDTNYSTYWSYQLNDRPVALGKYYFSIKVVPPILTPSTKFDKCYLGINCFMLSNLNTDKNISIKIYLNRHLIKTETLYEKSSSGANEPVIKIDNIPDFYYTPERSLSNKQFFVNSEEILTADTYTYMSITGLTKIEIPVSNYEEFNAIQHVGILFETDNDTRISLSMEFNEVCFILQKEQDVAGEFYV